MQDPTLAVKEGLREVETQLGKLRVLWSEAEFAKGAAEAEVKSLRAELARAFEVRKTLSEMANNRAWGQIAEAAHATIWGIGCVVTNLLQSAEGSARELKRLRRSNEQVREALDAMEGESPVDAALRVAHARDHFLGEYNRVTNGVENQELERLRVELKNLHAAANLELQASENRRLAETQAIRAGWAKDREELLRRNRVVVDERDAALADVRALRESWSAIHAQRDKARARVEELEREVASLRAPRQTVRDECAASLFGVLRPGAEPPRQGTYVFNTALAEVTEEINALRKDRETLNRVRGAVGVES